MDNLSLTNGIVDLGPTEIQEVAGGPVLPFIAIGMAAVGLFVGGTGLGLAYGRHLQKQ